MKKLTLTIASLIAAAFIFAGGVYAAQWLSFTGDEQIEQSDNNVDEIMQILRNVNEGKITAEEANAQLEARISELEDMNPSGLAKQNKELREQISALEEQIAGHDEYVTHLEEELQRANESVQSHSDKTQQAVEEARTIGGE